jgi:cytoskeleton protein RodZ
VTARAPYLRGATALLGVGLAVLFGSWWYGRLKHDVPPQTQTAPLGAEQPAPLAPVLPQPHSDSPTLAPGPAVAPPPESPSQSLAGEAAKESAAAVKPELPVGKTTAAAEPALPHVSESPVTTNTGTVVQHQDVGATVEPAVSDLPIAPLASEHGRLVKASRAPMGEDVLVIKANDESWAEVVDANGYQLLYYPLRPATVLRLQGQAPFRVFLGNAPAVDLSVNEKRFDHTRFHRRNRTARFTVDDAP